MEQTSSETMLKAEGRNCWGQDPSSESEGLNKLFRLQNYFSKSSRRSWLTGIPCFSWTAVFNTSASLKDVSFTISTVNLGITAKLFRSSWNGPMELANTDGPLFQDVEKGPCRQSLNWWSSTVVLLVHMRLVTYKSWRGPQGPRTQIICKAWGKMRFPLSI